MFCGNDQIARGAMDALRERGFDVPGDVAVVGFDNWEIVAAATRPPLTTVRQPIQEIGSMAASVLLEAIGGKPLPTRILMEPELVVRMSTRALGNPSVKKRSTR